MHFTKTIITWPFLLVLAKAHPTIDSQNDLPLAKALPPSKPGSPDIEARDLGKSLPLSIIGGTPAVEARDLERRTNLVSFVNYQSPGCTGSATQHTPQTAGICHTITGNSVNYYNRVGSCVRESLHFLKFP
jgi:hypothetical protein